MSHILWSPHSEPHTLIWSPNSWVPHFEAQVWCLEIACMFRTQRACTILVVQLSMCAQTYYDPTKSWFSTTTHGLSRVGPGSTLKEKLFGRQSWFLNPGVQPTVGRSWDEHTNKQTKTSATLASAVSELHVRTFKHILTSWEARPYNQRSPYLHGFFSTGMFKWYVLLICLSCMFCWYV